MKQDITGDLTGLKASQIKILQRIYRRRMSPGEIISPELATFMCEQSAAMHRQVGVLVNRRGNVEHVMVGDASRTRLPDVRRLRGAPGRFRGLRLVHTNLRNEKLTRDDLTDLALLRLDLVAAVNVDAGGRAGLVHIGHLLPDNPTGTMWRELAPEPAHRIDVNCDELMAGLEAEFNRTFDRTMRASEVTGDGAAVALLVHVTINDRPARFVDDAKARIAELCELCKTAGVRVLDVITQRRRTSDPKYLVGRGKLEQILLRAMQLGAETVIFDQDLTSGQARAIAEFTELKIVDRTMLILDIFAQHAKSRDGKLQVELAQLEYALPRLMGKGTMMSRLAGGIGGRGPGEMKLEIDRRRARDRITLLRRKLEAIARTRRLRRQQRGRRGVPIVAIVGYTNAGKSTLLNALTQGNARSENMLFATLDPISRRLRFPREREVVITDTVGFIRDLPPNLITAFRATLEELDDADLLVHVVDASDEHYERHLATVSELLNDLDLGEKPRLLAFNKCDRLTEDRALQRARSYHGFPISAFDRDSFGPLLAAIQGALWKEGIRADLGATHVPTI